MRLVVDDDDMTLRIPAIATAIAVVEEGEQVKEEEDRNAMVRRCRPDPDSGKQTDL